MTLKRSDKFTPGPWSVYRCQFVDKDGQHDSACGLNGHSFDWSYDECHHPLKLADARLIALAPEMFAFLSRLAQDDEEIDISIHPDDYREWTKAKARKLLEKLK